MGKVGAAAESPVHDRRQRLERHDRRRLPALHVPLAMRCLHGRQSDRADPRQGTRNETQSRLPHARLQLRPLADRTRCASSPRSWAGRPSPTSSRRSRRSDYSSYLTNIANSGADTFINIEFGNDGVASTKQAVAVRHPQEDEAGRARTSRRTFPTASARRSWPASTERKSGTFRSPTRYPLSKIFLDDFEKMYPGVTPRWTAHIALHAARASGPTR